MRPRPLGLLALAAFATASLATAPLTFAQDADPSRSDEALRQGRWALQFGVAPGLTLGSFGGSTASGKVHLRDCLALRLGFTGSAFADDSENADVEINVTTGGNPDPFERTAEGERTGESSNFRVDLDLPLVLYVGRSGARLRPFVGAGPMLGLQSGSTSGQDVRSQQQTGSDRIDLVELDYETETRQWRGGIAGLVGAEWFATNALSFSAEYGTVVAYQHTAEERRVVTTQRNTFDDRTTTDTDADDSTAARWTWGTRAVRFGITLYL